jgi:hypothetical protein
VSPQPVPASAAVPVREHGPRSIRLGDFTLDASVLPITGLALVVGAAGAGAAYCLLRPTDAGHLLGMVSLSRPARQADRPPRGPPSPTSPVATDLSRDRAVGTDGGVTYPAGRMIVAIARPGSQCPRIEVISPSSLRV